MSTGITWCQIFYYLSENWQTELLAKFPCLPFYPLSVKRTVHASFFMMKSRVSPLKFITKNQSKWYKNCRTQSTTSTIFNMVATMQQEGHVDEEPLAKAVWCYPVLHDKSMKEFKDQNMKENMWQVAESIAEITSGRSCLQLFLTPTIRVEKSRV